MNKERVAEFWDRASCGEELYLSGNDYARQAEERYRLEPYIKDFIEPARWFGKKVLEIGVGLGADHQLLAMAGAHVSGIDLTERAVAHTRERFQRLGLKADLRQGDAEALPFPSDTFDMVYSWGVIHHSPNTEQAFQEILRVLKPGGTFKIMIYHKWSIAGLMLWGRYGLLAGKPFRSLASIYSAHLESPGTKAYSMSELREMAVGTVDLSMRVELTHAELLESDAGQRHRGLALSIARRVWPRWLIRRIAKGYGLFLLIEGKRFRLGDVNITPLSKPPLRR